MLLNYCGEDFSAPHICLTAGSQIVANPVKQADGFPDNPNKYFPSANATVVTLQTLPVTK